MDSTQTATSIVTATATVTPVQSVDCAALCKSILTTDATYQAKAKETSPYKKIYSTLSYKKYSEPPAHTYQTQAAAPSTDSVYGSGTSTHGHQSSGYGSSNGNGNGSSYKRALSASKRRLEGFEDKGELPEEV